MIAIIWNSITKLLKCFPVSIITSEIEFAAYPSTNSFFMLKNCKTETDIKCKVLEYLSRDSYKTEPFSRKNRNEEFHNYILDGINRFLDADFTKEDMDKIYTKLGNGINHEKTLDFIESGYDLKVLERK